MRRLPVYFLLDISDSMVGEPINEVGKGFEQIVAELRNDPYCLETVFISVLGFAGKGIELAPLTEICLFNPPALPVGSGTSLGAGLNLLMDKLDKEVKQTTAAQKGDWKPIVFLFTDGAPTDQPEAAIKRWLKSYKHNASLIAVTFGENADVALLEQLSDTVLTLKDLSKESLKEFFRWVSASLKVSSIAVTETGKSGINLAKNCINLEKAVAKDKLDENFAILPVKCVSKGGLWLGKYAASGRKWKLVGAYPVDEKSYNNLGGGSQAGQFNIADTDSLPACPLCHQSQGLVKCANCGQLFCWQQEHNGKCPWCNMEIGPIRQVSSMDVSRSRG